MHTILLILIGLGIVQAVFVGILLLRFPGPNRGMSRLLALVLTLTAILMASELLDLLDIKIASEPVRDFFILIDLLLAGMMYLLTCFIIGRKRALNTSDLIHTLPFVLGSLWMGTGFRYTGTSSPGSFSAIPDAVAIVVGYKGAVWFIYMRKSLSLAYDRKAGHSAFIRELSNRLMARLVWPFIIISLISYTTFWLMYFGVALPLDSDYLGALFIVLFVYYFTYAILREPGYYIRTISTRNRPKYSNSSMDKLRAETYISQIGQYLEEKKPYLDENLKLPDVADTLGLSVNDLSQVINEGMGKTFPDLLNEYRLKEVKRKLLDPAQDYKTILALSLESGFQSKASFNRIFKAKEGMTPSEFRETYRSHPIV
jgi:AraC-like DNA-binding protein